MKVISGLLRWMSGTLEDTWILLVGVGRPLAAGVRLVIARLVPKFSPSLVNILSCT